MIIEEMQKGAFFANLAEVDHIFHDRKFLEINEGKVEQVHYLLFRDTKARFGLILGGDGTGMLRSPFSAPFGGFISLKKDPGLEQMDAAIRSLKEWILNRDCSTIRITFPPLIYGSSYYSKWVNVLLRAGFEISCLDLNYFLPLDKFRDGYMDHIRRNARKNLNTSKKYKLEFLKCSEEREFERCYEVIRSNRETRGFPLRMSWDQVRQTTKVVPASFLLVNFEGKDIAAALTYKVTSDIEQVIYWGELADYDHLRPMNFLSYKLFEYFEKEGREIVDIGPSTEHSVPNYGLCEFKESLGCEVDHKFTLTWTTN